MAITPILARLRSISLRIFKPKGAFPPLYKNIGKRELIAGTPIYSISNIPYPIKGDKDSMNKIKGFSIILASKIVYLILEKEKAWHIKTKLGRRAKEEFQKVFKNLTRLLESPASPIPKSLNELNYELKVIPEGMDFLRCSLVK